MLIPRQDIQWVDVVQSLELALYDQNKELEMLTSFIAFLYSSSNWSFVWFREVKWELADSWILIRY